MDKQQTNLLERRNLQWQENIQKRLDEVHGYVKENNRTLRGSNGDVGLVSEFTGLSDKVKEISSILRDISIVIYGKPRDIDQTGVLGDIKALKEERETRQELIKKQKKQNREIRWWIITSIVLLLLNFGASYFMFQLTH